MTTTRQLIQDTQRKVWKETARDDPRVLAWIEKNPPPEEWEDEFDALDWAFTEMPDPDSLVGRALAWLGL